MPPMFLLNPPRSIELPFSLGGIDGNVDSLKKSLEEVKRWWSSTHSEGDDSLLTSYFYATYIDKVIERLASSAYDIDQGMEGRAAVMALGGYGRREMGPHSDIDLLVIYDGGEDPYISNLTSSIFYPLWDAGIKVGAATRSVKECRDIAKKDVKSLTSMLDARFVAGDEGLAEEFQDFMKEWFAKPSVRKSFIRNKMIEFYERRRKYGDSVYLLQPNVKEGEGGLRDFHTLVWLTRATYPDAPINEMLMNAGLSNESVEELLKSVRFLWRVRHALHLTLGKCQDRLGEEHQGAVASMLGFKGNEFSSAAEQLMQAYYWHAFIIHKRSQWAFEHIEQARFGPLRRLVNSAIKWSLEKGVTWRAGRKLSVTEDAIKDDPMLMLRIFVHAKKHRLMLDATSKEILSKYAYRINDDLRSCDGAKRMWRELFKNPKHLGETFSEMHECGCLDKWIPEMVPMIHRIQHDGFHLYTVDVHTINAVFVLSRLAKGWRNEHRDAAEAMRSLTKPHVVLLATLLHDVGKGHRGNHEHVGGGLAEGIARRMGFSDQECADIVFLVRSHMLMPKLAHRRDITDSSLIERFAHTVGTPQMLSMLYLITFADLVSIGPHMWSAWKEGLLNELFLRTKKALMAGGDTEAQHEKTISKKIRLTSRILGKEISVQRIEGFLSDMPERYALLQKPPTIATHLTMLKDLKNDNRVVCDVRNDHERGVSEISVATRDAPGLFAKIAGVLSANGLNIVDAELYTNKHGIAVDLIRVTDLKNMPVEDPVRWSRIIRDMNKIVDEKALISLIRRHLKPPMKRKPRKNPPEVEIDNDVSATDTVMEVHADDRPGLLYRIAISIADHGCTIDRARITTHVDRVVDVFYIRDSSGLKITNKDQLKTLRDDLLGKLAGEGYPT